VLAAGLPVFVENPPAWNSRQTFELRQASRRAGKPLMTAFTTAFISALCHRLPDGDADLAVAGLQERLTSSTRQ